MKIPPADTKEYKEYFEVKLGGGHPNSGLEKYLYNDRKVLSFRVLWDDQTLEGMVNFFVLNYFLADDSVEVKEIVKQNSGKDPFPLLLHRGKLPKVPIMTHYPVLLLLLHYYYYYYHFKGNDVEERRVLQAGGLDLRLACDYLRKGLLDLRLR